MHTSWLPLCMTAAILTGCQTPHTLQISTRFQEMTFPAMWNTYRSCQTRDDANDMWTDAQQLHKAVRAMKQHVRASRLLPDAIEQAIAEPPPRLAVDPQAMAAACAIMAGRTVKDAGKIVRSEEMFRFVLSHFSQPRYAYYVAQARLGLELTEQREPEQT